MILAKPVDRGHVFKKKLKSDLHNKTKCQTNMSPMRSYLTAKMLGFENAIVGFVETIQAWFRS
ncbi:hypothetical protein AtNW77_Chr3g0172001 [Arabidopsis thaliana]|uniref:Uncharacterized protein n=3 Tax=Arabidopsis TaxID=3701 RepID=B3H6F6_ARATH|nr:uncharacterized protein AT3G15359 [Arabidopsis thaliana]AEE75648.1 hypothetical protein AT3G15359 [Arabidopsis thaliana]KAG7625324.1 hypothetical protein ISN45_At03g015700 [Arabidopsis thaliana x Arabidopsis arenosa]VYS57456.1 unnamed protein product [Arabidopsis thaliana]|eukprot:NP_001118634.1 hypothetical protein AT3G15359 [Arabidopsis thaliana]